MNNALDPRLGNPELSFPDPTAWGSRVAVLGVVIAVGGAIVAGLVGLEAMHRPMNGDRWAGVAMAGTLIAAGVFMVIGALRDLKQEPTWNLTAHGAQRVVRTGPASFYPWACIERLTIVRRTNQHGRVRGYYLEGAPVLIHVPSERAAEQGHSLWRAARGGRAS